MPRFGVSITKSTSFRNSNQEFSNVYYYVNGSVSLPDVAQADNIIDFLKAFEVGIHAGTVTFLRGRLWSDTGDKATNNMISQKTLTGTGSASSILYDKERAFLFRLRAGNDSRGQPVYLRKWYHTNSNGPGGVTVQPNVLANTTGFTNTERNTMAGVVDGLRNITVNGQQYDLCAKGGRNFSVGAQFSAHNFFEHHQLGDQWRAQ